MLVNMDMFGESGGMFDVLNPNEPYGKTEVLNGVSSGIDTITVSKKPRYIFYSATMLASPYNGFLGIIDVEKGQAVRAGYYGSAAHTTFEDWSTYTNVFTTISDSQVVYNQAAYSASHRATIAMYY